MEKRFTAKSELYKGVDLGELLLYDKLTIVHLVSPVCRPLVGEGVSSTHTVYNNGINDKNKVISP